MNVVTITWSLVASACLTLAAMNVLVWFKKRTEWSNLLIFAMAAGTAGIAFGELAMMMAGTPAQFGRALRWTHLPVWLVIVSLVLFVRTYLRSGRPWLAWTVCGVRTLSLVLNFVFSPNLNYREITSLHQIRFLGESVSIAQGASNPWMLLAQAGTLLLAVFAVDAAFTVRRREDRRKALVLSSGIMFFVLASLTQSVLVFWGIVSMPITISVFFLGIVAITAYEMSLDVRRAAQLSNDLRESEARLRDIMFSVGDWVWEVDEKEVYTFSSTKGSELFGHVIGKTPFDLMPPDEAKRVGALFSEIAAKKAPITDLESWRVGKNGEKIYLLTNGVPILDETGNLKGYRGVDKDITDRKNMEESLRTSEEKFREFFKNTPDYCYIISPEGTILNVNSAVLRALGYEKEELIGKPVSMIYESGSFARMKELFGQWKTSGQVRNEEVVIITRQGEKRTVLLNVGAVRDNAGTIIYSTSVQTDITERKLAEASRREGLERYKAVVEGFDGLIYICSQDHRIEFMNKRLIERTGRNAAGELCYKALHDKDAVCEWCVNEKVFEGETMRWEVQSPKDHRWYYVVNTPIYHVDGTMSKQAMIMDITERKLAEEALDESRTQIAAVMNSTNDWIWSVDPVRFGLLTWNRGLADHFLKRVGLTIAVGMTPYDLLPPERAAQWPELYNRALREGTFTTEYDVTNQANILLLSINVMKRGGQVFGISVFGKDITERKVAEEALKENESALRNSRKDLQLLAGRLIFAQEEELRRLSRELHDDLTQRLAVLAIEAGKLELDLDKMPER